MKLLISQEELENFKSRDSIPCECELCHVIFTLPKNRVLASLNGNRRHRNKYCSIKCRTNAKFKERIEFNCNFCDKKIYKLPSNSLSNNHFCSTKCSAKFYANIRRKPIKIKLIKEKISSYTKLTCNCGKQFPKKKTVIKSSKTKRFFCSRSCKMKFLNKEIIIHKPKSQAESFLFNLIKNDFPNLIVEQNTRKMLPDGLEIDIYIPSLKLAIELNGPFHFYPIFGIDKLKNTQNRDIRKQLEINKLGLDSIVIDISNLTNQKTTKEFLTKYYISSIKPLIDGR